MTGIMPFHRRHNRKNILVPFRLCLREQGVPLPRILGAFSWEGAVLLVLLAVLAGCRPEDPGKATAPVRTEQVSRTGESDGSRSPAPFTISEEDLSDLGAATDKFTQTFSDDLPSSAPGTAEKGGRLDKTTVSEEVREKYSHLPDISFAPQIIDRKGDEGVERHLLRYRFEPNTDLRWSVQHRVRKKVLMAGHESEIETVSQIVRRWHIDVSAEGGIEGGEVDAGEAASLESTDDGNTQSIISYFIDQMILDQQETGKEPVRYDSRTDEEVPLEIAAFGTEKAVGQEITRFKIDSFGMMTDKEQMVREFGGNPRDSRVLFPFPAEPVAVGESWTLPYTIFLRNRDKTIKTVNSIMKFTLEDIIGGLATIGVQTIPTSLIGDPYLEGQLAERVFTGSCRFDMVRGKTVRTEIEFSRTVPEAYGSATFLDYKCRIVEEWIRE